MRYGLLGSVGKRKVRLFATQSSGNLSSPAMIAQLRTLPRKPYHLHIPPGNPAPQAGSNGLHARLFGGKTGSQPLCGIRLPRAVADLSRGKDPSEKAISIAIQRPLDAWNLRDVNSSSDDHSDTQQVTGYKCGAQNLRNYSEIGPWEHKAKGQ